MTDPYTPTTEEVREMMLNEYGDDFADSFDRWLAQHEAKVRAEVIDWQVQEGLEPEFADETLQHFALPVPSTGTDWWQEDQTENMKAGVEALYGAGAMEQLLAIHGHPAVPEPSGDPQCSEPGHQGCESRTIDGEAWVIHHPRPTESGENRA